MSALVIPCSGPVLILYWFSCRTVLPPGSWILLQLFSNTLQVALRVPSRGHSVEQFIFLAVMQPSLVVTRTNVYLAVDWQWKSILNDWERVYRGLLSSWSSRKRVSTIRYLATDISLCSGFTCHGALSKRGQLYSSRRWLQAMTSCCSFRPFKASSPSAILY
jgi:hypothetical protein